MEEYIVSARKYRPMSFGTMVGQSALTTTLKNAISKGKLAHAYLFCGPRGVGKTTCARIFAKTINCLSPRPDGESCGECESCRGFDENRSLNIHELDAASNNSVEDIRELIKQVLIPPQVGKYKVFIIDEVHMLSSAAFNAFLKTLEEPPSYVIFILATTEKHKILPTILSRCQVYDFNRMTVDGIVNHLKGVAQKEGYTAEEEALQLIAEKADGGMRDALSIFDQMVSFCNGELTYQKVCASLNVLDTDYYFRLVDYFLENKVQECMLLFNEILSRGFDGSHFISGLASHMRNLLVAKDASTLPLLETSEKNKARYSQQAQKCKMNFIFHAIKLCNDCDQTYRTSHNKRLQVEICLIQCAQLTLEEDSPGSGRSPKKILKPIFLQQSVEEKNQQETAQQSSATTASSETKSEPKPNISAILNQQKTTPILRTFSIGQIGPSLKKATAEAKENLAHASGQSVKMDNPITEEAVTKAWFSYINSMSQEHVAMAQRMKEMMPKLISEHTFQITVNNNQVAEYMHPFEQDILDYMRNAIGNSTLTMDIHVAAAMEVKRLLSKPDLYKRMVTENKVVSKLAEMLELEII